MKNTYSPPELEIYPAEALAATTASVGQDIEITVNDGFF